MTAGRKSLALHHRIARMVKTAPTVRGECGTARIRMGMMGSMGVGEDQAWCAVYTPGIAVSPCALSSGAGRVGSCGLEGWSKTTRPAPSGLPAVGNRESGVGNRGPKAGRGDLRYQISDLRGGDQNPESRLVCGLAGSRSETWVQSRPTAKTAPTAGAIHPST